MKNGGIHARNADEGNIWCGYCLFTILFCQGVLFMRSPPIPACKDPNIQSSSLIWCCFTISKSNVKISQNKLIVLEQVCQNQEPRAVFSTESYPNFCRFLTERQQSTPENPAWPHPHFMPGFNMSKPKFTDTQQSLKDREIN